MTDRGINPIQTDFFILKSYLTNLDQKLIFFKLLDLNFCLS